MLLNGWEYIGQEIFLPNYGKGKITSYPLSGDYFVIEFPDGKRYDATFIELEKLGELQRLRSIVDPSQSEKMANAFAESFANLNRKLK